MNNLLKTILFLCLLVSAPKNEFEDANTRRNIDISTGEFEGLYLEKEQESFDSKKVQIVFIFTKLPSAYIDYYDSTNNFIIFDFYDASIGNSLISNITEYPIKETTVEEFQCDLNEGVEGFEPDIRNIVRVKFKADCLVPYKFEVDDFGFMSLKFDWNKEIEKEMKGKNKSYILIQIISVAAAVALSISIINTK